jgi:acetyltransferase
VSVSLERFFDPRSIAVVGASNAEGKMGNRFMRHLDAGFAGEVYPVHPTETEIEGRRAWPTLAALPEDVDLLITLIPAARLLDVLRDCPPGRARFLLAIPSGFGELPGEGATLQRELVDEAGRRGMRVVGPNTVGMLNGPAGLNASMVPPLPAVGRGLSCVTQSGGFAMATWMYAHNHGLAVNKLCDLGNTADVDVADVLRHLGDDAATEVVGLFLESSRRPDDFAAAVAELAARKPVVVARTGASDDGRRASLAHLGTVWERHDVLPAGVAVVDTGLEVLHASKALAWQPRPRGRRVAILTGSGGVGAELSDLCVRHGLTVPPLSEGLRARLGAHLPDYAALGNPVDVTPIWWEYPRLYPPLISALLDSDEIDMVIVTVIDVASEIAELADSLAVFEAQRRTAHDDKPVYVYFGAPDRALANRRTIEAARLPCYASTAEVVRAAAAVAPAGRP